MDKAAQAVLSFFFSCVYLISSLIQLLHSLCHTFNRYLLSFCYVPGSVIEEFRHIDWFDWLISKNLEYSGHPKVSYTQKLFFNYFLNWSVVNLQCYVSFRCTAKWFSYTYTYILFQILFHYRLLQDIEYRSLCYIVGPCCLSILYIQVCICWSQTPN